MTHFNIVHTKADRVPGVRAYQEVIDSIRWGLQQLGHHATYSVDCCCHQATNIIFGGHLSPELLVSSPDDTIYYNLEQIRGHSQYNQDGLVNTIKFIASTFRIWDYSSANIPVWESLVPKYTTKFVPIGYAPVLTRIEKIQEEDIDVLIYGSLGVQRLSVFSSFSGLVNAGVSVVFASGLFGASRDSLIARAKIVLNIAGTPHSKIFEIVRVSYLLANSKAVVADFYPDSYIEQDIAGALIFVPTGMIAEACQDLLGDEGRRTELERGGFQCITRRDIRMLLSTALVSI